MNKMSAAIAQKLGRKSQYEEIRERSEVAPLAITNNSKTSPIFSSEESNSGRQRTNHVSEPTATASSSSSLSPTRSALSRVPVWMICLAVSLALVFATLGERASEHAIAKAKSLNDESIPFYPWCEYHSTAFFGGSVKVLQTSLSEPSKPLMHLACVPASQLAFSFPSITTEDKTSSIIPHAAIKLNLQQNAHPDRSPIMGFGGAFTEASALNYNSLSKEGKAAVMELLFGKDGLGYSLGRVHMNSCDFCVASYAFSKEDGDFELNNFDTEVTHDVECGMVDMMLSASAKVKQDWTQDELHLLASPWSPPPWMKAPTKEDPPGALHAENMTDSALGSCLREGTGPSSKYAKAWALYFSKFLTAYQDLGLPLHSVTVQNEPEFPAPWEACSYNPKTEGDFVGYHLGPVLRAEHPDVKILTFDHNKDHAPRWAKELMNVSNPASEYIDGIAIHWYAGGMDRMLDGGVGSPNMHRLVSVLDSSGAKKDHIILGTEACHCPYTAYGGGDINVAWARAERYAHTILADLAAGSNGWVEWNLLLDTIGGPNHLGNVCDAPLLAAPRRAKLDPSGATANKSAKENFEKLDRPFGPIIGDNRTREELNALGFPAKYLDVGVIVQPMYQYMGHISRHVRPGSRAVMALVDQSPSGGLTFRPDGAVVAGGGMNDLARVGIELTTWPCEGSTRQQFAVVPREEGEGNYLQVYGHDWLGAPTKSCVSRVPDKSFKGLLLTKCNKNAGSFEVITKSEHVNLVLTNGDRASTTRRKCLSILPLENNGGAYGPRGGAQVNLGNCEEPAANWILTQHDEIVSKYFENEGGDVCLTTGWPFLQAGAFEAPNTKDNVVVVMNEAAETANFAMLDDKKLLVKSSIQAHSIQTLLFTNFRK